MNVINEKNKGINMVIADIRALLEEKKNCFAKQQARKEKLEQTMANTCSDIEQLEYTLRQMECAGARPKRVVSCRHVSDFFIHASEVFDYLQHRLHRRLNYVWFCLALCSHYDFENRKIDRPLLSPATVLGYFKRERDFLG